MIPFPNLKIAAAAAAGTLWSQTDHDAAITIQDGGATAYVASPATAGGRGAKSYPSASGSRVTRTIEYLIVGPAQVIYVGLGTENQALGSRPPNSEVYLVRANGSSQRNGAGGTTPSTFTGGDRIQVVMRSDNIVNFYLNGAAFLTGQTWTGLTGASILPMVYFGGGDNAGVGATISANPALPEGGAAWGTP